MMIASVHLADVGVGKALGILGKTPKPGSVPGLRQAQVGVAAPLSGSLVPHPTPGRVGLIAFWDDDESLDRFEDSHPLAAKLAGGWSVRLEPLRVHGSWPGLADDIPTARKVSGEGQAFVLTMGRLRFSQAPRFLKASARAEGAVVKAPGLVFATGLAKPPFVATASLWESAQPLMAYAYGRNEPAHPSAIDAGIAKPFHHQEAFIRFHPYNRKGFLAGKNPLAQ